KYFVGRSTISLDVNENKDWFDIQAIIRFGEFEIPFLQLRSYILKKKNEFTLPNGEIAVIPQEWFIQYSELFAYIEDADPDDKKLRLEKHHLALVHELQSSENAKVNISSKLEKLKEFEEIEDHPFPVNFKGKLRPYQKAGYN